MFHSVEVMKVISLVHGQSILMRPCTKNSILCDALNLLLCNLGVQREAESGRTSHGTTEDDFGGSHSCDT